MISSSVSLHSRLRASLKSKRGFVKGLVPVGQSDSWHHLLLTVVMEDVPHHDLLLSEPTLEIKGIFEVKERLWFKSLGRLGLCWRGWSRGGGGNASAACSHHL